MITPLDFLAGVMVRARWPRAVGAFVVGWITLSAAALPLPSGEWSVLRTAHFTIFTDADPHRVVDIGMSLERFRAVFAHLASELDLNSPVPTKIFAFRDSDSYAPYKVGSSGEGVRILGQFLGRRDGNFITLDAGSDERSALSVIFHEYVHYFVRHNFPRVPLWFHEGLAEYYSTFWTDAESAIVGLPVARHVDWLRRSGELRLDQVLAVRHQSPEHQEVGAVGRFYAVSWVLVHYLLSGDEERLGRLAEYLILLDEGREAGEALAETVGLGGRDLESRLRRYVTAGAFPSATVSLAGLPSTSAFDVRPLAPSEALFQTGELALQVGRLEEASRRFEGALDLAPDHGDSRAGLAAVRDLQGRLEEADQLYREAIQLGTTYPATFLRWGRHHLARMEAAAEAGDPVGARFSAAQARAAFARAVELDNRFAEAHAMLGIAHLFGDVDAALGVPHLERAVEWLPSRTDLVYRLVQLLIRQGDLVRAERLVETVLVRKGEPELLWRAREAVERAGLMREADTAVRRGEVEQGMALLDEAISKTSDDWLRADIEKKRRPQP